MYKWVFSEYVVQREGFAILLTNDVIADVIFLTIRQSLLLCRWYLTDWTTAMRRLPACQLSSIAGCSLYSTLRHD